MVFKIIPILSIAFFCSHLVFGATSDIYSFKVVAIHIVNSPIDEVFAKEIKKEIINFLTKDGRFEIREFDEKLPEINPSIQLDNTNDYKDFIYAMKSRGINALFIAKIDSKGAPQKEYEFSLVLLIPANEKIIQFYKSSIDEPYLISDFVKASHEGIKKIIGLIPFDGTVIKREGFNVIIDRGAPKIAKNMVINVYSMEEKDGNLTFVVTGKVSIIRAEKLISFGRILVENRPMEIKEGDKVLLKEVSHYDVNRFSFDKSKSREMELKKTPLFNVALSLHSSLVTHSLVPRGGKNPKSSTYLYPGGSFEGEFWFTRRIYLSTQCGFYSAPMNMDDTKLNSGIVNYNLQIGYTFDFPNVDILFLIKSGYISDRFFIDESNELFFNSSTYRGLLTTLGSDWGLTSKFNLGIRLSYVFFATIDEGEFTSGSKKDVTSFEVKLHAIYSLAENVDLVAKLGFNYFGADFSGTGTSQKLLDSSKRSSRIIGLGMVYYF